MEKIKSVMDFLEGDVVQKKPGRPKKDSPKVKVSIRLDQAVVDHFKRQAIRYPERGGWQTQLNNRLARAVAMYEKIGVTMY